MRLKLFLLLCLAAVLPALAQQAAVSGVVVNANTGAPIPGATVMVNNSNAYATTSPSGSFQISNAPAGEQIINISAPGYNEVGLQVQLTNGDLFDMRQIMMEPSEFQGDFYDGMDELVFDENVLEDEEGAAQSINALTGASDDVYYNTASYNFGPRYFNYRGYDSRYQNVYINGLKFNDLIRGRFNFSSLLGMTSRAFRNKTTTIGTQASAYGFGNIAGSTNYNTVTSGYAPGFNASVAYTNSMYMLRAMATYSTGINSKGWGLTVSAIGRYANEGIVEGTFYNSGGLFLSLEKEFNRQHSLTLTAFGGPTQRGLQSNTYQEAYDLAGSNLYNPAWGWQDGKKRNARIRNTFDPTVILNWIYKINEKSVLNTAVSTRWVNYSQSALNWYNANDPQPNYYRNLPSYWEESNPDVAAMLTSLWRNDPTYRQINWDRLYQINYLNNYENHGVADADRIGSSYILEDRHSNQFGILGSSYLDQRINDWFTLQGGVNFNYTNASFYKTVRDLLGGEFWLDVDPFSDDVSTINETMLQNDLDNPNRRVGEGDRFGYDYNIVAIQAQAWLQNVITLPQWDINYGATVSYTQFQREGHMRNGRAPENSLGKGAKAKFTDGGFKAGATYKLDGRNFVRANVYVGTQAPIADNIFISPRVKNAMADVLQSEKIYSFDASYIWNYRRFRGSITGYYTMIDDATEHTAFYDDRFKTFTNFTLSGVKRLHRGLELGAAYKITPSITATLAATWSRSLYKNNPRGTRSTENGMEPDSTQTVYFKNLYIGSTPQTTVNLGFDYAAPKMWFFGINGTWSGDMYVNPGIPYHEVFYDLWQQYPNEADMLAKMSELTAQEKLANAFTLNLSIGKLIYLNRKASLNINLNINNVLNNRNIVTYAYQQNRIYTSDWNPNHFANRYGYAQGIRIFLNVGLRF